MSALLTRAIAGTHRDEPVVTDGVVPVAPEDKAPKRRGLKKIGAVSYLEPALTLEELPAMIHERVTAYLSDPAPGSVLLLALPAGSGKTTALVETAERFAAGGKRVIYAGPRHDFFIDIQAISRYPQWWYEWQPRHAGSESLDATCRWAQQMEAWLKRGYPAMEFCRNARICGFDYIKNSCPYHAQKALQPPIVFAQHQHVAIKHPLMDQMDLLIGDELPLGAFLHKWTIPPSSIVSEGAQPAIEQLLYTLFKLTSEVSPRKGGWSGPALMTEIGGAAYVAALCDEYMIATDATIITPRLQDAFDVEKADYAHVPYLLSLLKQEANANLKMPDYVRRIRVTPEGLHLLLRRRPGKLPNHIVWCDATGQDDVYYRMLGKPIEIVRPRVQMAGRIFQVWASLNNKYSIKGRIDHCDEQKQARQNKRKDLKKQVDHILSKGYQNPAIITYQSLLDDFAPDVDRGHFGAERGTNRLAACDCLIVVGTPMPPHQDILETAAMLYDEQVEPFREEWSVDDRSFDGTGEAYPLGGYWSDSRLQNVVEQFREAELLQAVHRARPLRRAVDVWLLTNAAVPGLPVQLVSLNQLFDAPDKVDPYGWPALRQWVKDRLETTGSVTASEIAEFAGVQWAAGKRYLEALATQDNHTISRVQPAKGRSAQALVKG